MGGGSWDWVAHVHHHVVGGGGTTGSQISEASCGCICRLRDGGHVGHGGHVGDGGLDAWHSSCWGHSQRYRLLWQDSLSDKN